MNKKMKILLVTSLCFNFLIGGFILGMEGRKIAHHQMENKEFAKEMMAFRRSQDKEKEMLRKERKKALRIIMSDNYSHDKYIEQIDKINVIQGQMFKEMSLKIAQIIQETVPEKRKALMPMLQRSLGGPKNKK